MTGNGGWDPMRDPRVSTPLADLDAELRLHLEKATVPVRLALLEDGLAALAARRSCKVELGQITLTADLLQVRALSRCFLADPSLQVRRRLARRIAILDWEERLPLLERLLADADDSV